MTKKRRIKFIDMIQPTLNVLFESKREMDIFEIDDEIFNRLNISQEDREKLHLRTNQTEVAYHSAWARTYLKKCGLVMNPKHKIWVIDPIYDGGEINTVELVSAVTKHNEEVYKKDYRNEIVKKLYNYKDISNNNESLIQELSQKYKDSKITLFLGAGVSMAANMRSWDALVARFMVNRFKNLSGKKYSDEILAVLTELEKLNRENSLISQTRYIKQNLKPEEYLELLIDAVYHTDKEINIDNDLFEALMRLIRLKNDVKINEIITFNFDDLLERKLDKKNLTFESHVGYSKEKDESFVNVYHVHGLLRGDSKPDEIDLDRIVFSEEQYHKMYNDSFNWSNIKQINSLCENTCLFIGCSLSDPNMRRLLDIAHNNNDIKHYAILIKNAIITPNDLALNSEALKVYQEFDVENRNSYFNSIGIHVIWAESTADVPVIIDRIANAFK